jgi:hypothetical protein
MRRDGDIMSANAPDSSAARPPRKITITLNRDAVVLGCWIAYLGFPLAIWVLGIVFWNDHSTGVPELAVFILFLANVISCTLLTALAWKGGLIGCLFGFLLLAGQLLVTAWLTVMQALAINGW